LPKRVINLRGKSRWLDFSILNLDQIEKKSAEKGYHKTAINNLEMDKYMLPSSNKL